jgi:hypothetical protein
MIEANVRFSSFPRSRVTSFPRAAWECSQGALRRESCPTFCVYGTQRVRHGVPTQRVGTRRSALVARVPKLRLGNPDSEAPASRNGKLELPALNSQAGAWELAQSYSAIAKQVTLHLTPTRRVRTRKTGGGWA